MVDNIVKEQYPNTTLPSNSIVILDDSIYDFVEEVFIGIETKVYLTVLEKPEFIHKLKIQEGMLYGMNFLEFYLNQLYKNLVDKSDEFMQAKFEELGGLINYHPVYTLNIISNLIMKVYPMFPRSKLNTENQEKYLDSVKSITNTMKKYLLSNFHEELEKMNEEKSKSKEGNE